MNYQARAANAAEGALPIWRAIVGPFLVEDMGTSQEMRRVWVLIRRYRVDCSTPILDQRWAKSESQMKVNQVLTNVSSLDHQTSCSRIRTRRRRAHQYCRGASGSFWHSEHLT